MEFLDELIKQEIENLVVPGMTYAIVENDDLNIGSVGYKSLVPNKEKVENDTIYDIASLTKVVVTMPLVLKLIGQNKLQFNDKLKTYLPSFKYDDITIYHLLTHTSGLPADVDSKEISSKKEMLDKIYTMEKEYETGSKVLYSDLGYIFLGEMLEKIYGANYDK